MMKDVDRSAERQRKEISPTNHLITFRKFSSLFGSLVEMVHRLFQFSKRAFSVFISALVHGQEYERKTPYLSSYN